MFYSRCRPAGDGRSRYSDRISDKSDMQHLLQSDLSALLLLVQKWSTLPPLPQRELRAVRRAPSPEEAPKNRQLKNHHSYNNYNADIISYRNIRHRLGMYITKQAEQEIYLIAQKKLRWCPPPKKIHTQLPKLWV